jgi:regulator of replication initiation timing
MVHLRGERDALAERIATLEKQLADPIEVAGDQQLSDLQRRFELAVEDVRHLKTENARLEEKLAAASATPQAVVAADGQDWESQKRRLLASLEDDGDNVGEERRKERASIENTVRITDEVVAEKDREIRELEVRLLANEWAAAATEHTKQKAEKDAATEVLLSNDEIIRQHRVRIAGIEKELDQKLREAELEMSVQRAKIARDQAEIAESKTELETLRAMVGQAGGMENGAAPPKRRWLAKLGLGDDE